MSKSIKYQNDFSEEKMKETDTAAGWENNSGLGGYRHGFLWDRRTNRRRYKYTI